MKKILCVLLLSTSILLSGCSLFTRDLEILNTPVERAQLDVSDPAPLSLEGVEFKVITPDTSKDAFDDAVKKGMKPVYIGLTPKQYEGLARNIEKIQGYVVEQKAIINSYRNYYENVSPTERVH